MGSSFDLGFSSGNQQSLQRQQIAEQQRVQQQNTVGARLLDAINNAGDIKPQTKDENGNIIHNPEYDTAQQNKTKLLQQYTQLNSPEQHASFAQHLHGLIFGHPTPHTQQPALSPNSSPVPPAPDPNAAPSAAPPAPVEQPHPMGAAAPNHPLHAITGGIKALGDAIKNHAGAFANPLLPPQNPIDPALIAKYQRDPGEVAAERAQALWGERGQNALAVAQERTKALMASLQARPPRMLSQTTIPDLLDQIKVDPTMVVYAPDGHEISQAQLAEMPKGTIAREFRSGSQIFYALGDQNSKTLNVAGQVYDIPSVGPIKLGGEGANAAPMGQATSTLPKTSSSTDPFGLKSTSTHQTVVPPVSANAPAMPSSAGPVLQTRPPAPSAPPVPPNSLAAVNSQIAAANATSKTLNKGKPVSANAPDVPRGTLPPLDADGHVPPGVGNDLVRQYANNLLDGRDSKDIPNPRARAAAEAMASQYGWSQGAFTPREKVQFQVATQFLHQLQDSKSLSVLDSFMSREKIAHAMKDPQKMNIFDRITAYNLTPPEADFLKLYNAALGTVQGLASITRSGRSTEAAVQRLKVELPNVFQSSSSADAKDRIEQLLKEANTALQTNPMSVKGGPVSKNAPQIGQWKPPADAPAAPKEDGKALKADGKVIAISKGGQWSQP